jgi:hypothetical protein
MSKYITDLFMALAEQGNEMGVTVLVGGVRITGVACSPSFYTAWIQEQVKIWFVAGAKPIPVGTTAPRATRAQLEKLKADYDAKQAEAGDEGELEFPMLCLRNAKVQTGVQAYWTDHPYLLIAAEHVEAITLGSHTPDEE